MHCKWLYLAVICLYHYVLLNTHIRSSCSFLADCSVKGEKRHETRLSKNGTRHLFWIGEPHSGPINKSPADSIRSIYTSGREGKGYKNVRQDIRRRNFCCSVQWWQREARRSIQKPDSLQCLTVQDFPWNPNPTDEAQLVAVTSSSSSSSSSGSGSKQCVNVWNCLRLRKEAMTAVLKHYAPYQDV
jgi:hypothetical protein